jgi:hypothetical protein
MCLPPPFFLPVLLNAGDKGAQTFNLKNQTPGWIQIEYRLAEAQVILRNFQNTRCDRCVLFQAWEWSTESCSKSLGQRASEWHGSKKLRFWMETLGGFHSWFLSACLVNLVMFTSFMTFMPLEYSPIAYWSLLTCACQCQLVSCSIPMWVLLRLHQIWFLT